MHLKNKGYKVWIVEEGISSLTDMDQRVGLDVSFTKESKLPLENGGLWN